MSQNVHNVASRLFSQFGQWQLRASIIALTCGFYSLPGTADIYAPQNPTPAKIESPLDTGWSCRTSDRSDRTIRLCSPLIRSPETSAERLIFALRKRAKAWIVEEELWAAIADFNRIAELSPPAESEIFERAKLFMMLGKFKRAQQDYSKLIVGNTFRVTAYCGRGLAKLKLKQYEPAIEDYSAALKIEPGRLDCVVGRGDVYADLGQQDKALAEYAAAIAANERYWDAYFQRAALYKKLGDKHLAIADYSKVLELDFLNLRAAKSLRALGVIHPSL